MKIRNLYNILIISASIALSMESFAQDPTKYATVSDSSFRVYFNSDWENIDNPNNCTYFRKSYRISPDSVVIKDYFRSGKVQMEGRADKFVNPLFNGIVYWYFENGQVQNINTYAGGVLQGKATGYYENGKLNWVKNYDEGKPEGEFLSYFESGQLKESGRYRKGRKDGHWKKFNENKILISEADYKDGKQVGENNKTRYPKGALKTHKTFSKKGELLKEQVFFENGQLKYEKNYKNEVVQGPVTFYNEDGSVQGIQRYDGKKKTGITEWKNEQGKIVKITSFKDGKPDGKWMESYENGVTRIEGTYKEGEFKGKWNFYREDGTLMKWEEWENGVLQRERYYDRNGNSVRAQEWKTSPKLVNAKNLETLLNDSLTIPAEFATHDRLVVKIITRQGKVDTVEIIETANDKVDSILREFLIKTEWKGGKYDLEPATMANEYIIEVTKDGQFEVRFGSFYPVMQEKKDDKVEVTVERMPRFKGEANSLFAYISRNISYPASAKQNNIEGTVYIRFVVEPSGVVSNPEIARGVDSQLDEEVIKLVKEMPAWEPGEQRGRKVRVKYTLPVRFVLN